MRLKVGGAAVAELAAEKGGRAVGGVALAGDGTVAYARRVIDARARARGDRGRAAQRRGARGRPLVAATAAARRRSCHGSRPPARLLAYRLRSGQRGREESIWVADLGGGGAKRLARWTRRRGRLSDPGVAPGRVVWTRSDLGGDGRSLVRSRVVSAGVRAR